MRTKILGFLLILWELLPFAYGQRAETQRNISVAVIAPSISTSMEARRIISRQGWTQGKFKTADAILVVVRSSLSLPLQSSYTFVGELKADADGQLNISGPKFHVYLYQLGDDLECTELKHISYEAAQ